MMPIFLTRLSAVALSALAVGLSLPACGGTDMMSGYTRAFGDHVSAYQAELQDHQSAIQSVTDLSSITGIETDHALRLQDHMVGMHTELQDMTNCAGPMGEQPDPQDVLADLDMMQQESDAHQQAMAGASDIDSALAEEVRHQDQMTTMMSGMHEHASAMMDGTASYSCHMAGGDMGGGDTGGGMM